MLEEMRIRGLGVITDATLALDPGLTVVSGETGAGKTMVVTGLTLLLGARADAAVVRTGATQAVIEGRVQLPQDSPLRAVVEDLGGELDDDTLIVSRTLTAAGRSRAHIGGRAVPVGVLAELTTQLLTVHGQSDQLRLLQPGHQLNCLDRFADHEKLLRQFGSSFDRWRAAVRELAQLVAAAQTRLQEADLLRLGLAEIGEVDPQPGEDHALREEDSRLAHADALLAAAQSARVLLSGDGHAGSSSQDISALISAAQAPVQQAGEHDPKLHDIARRLDEIGYLAADLAGELASYAAGVDLDPARLAAVQQRRAQLSTLTRKYGSDIDAVLAWAQRSESRLAELSDDDGRIAELSAQGAEHRTEVIRLGARLSASRIKAGARLAARVTKELTQLAMPKAQLLVAIQQRPDPEGLELPAISGSEQTGPVGLTRTGFDDIEFRLTPHPGAPARPVAKGASGGELSRVMLALEVVLAGIDPGASFVFDEVDAGVGGQAAVQIGRRLGALAGSAQVVVVTHLPQVAAFADRHLVVSKSDDGQVTVSGVQSLNEEQRVLELARMLAGQQDSATAQAHARELRAEALAQRAELRAGH